MGVSEREYMRRRDSHRPAPALPEQESQEMSNFSVGLIGLIVFGIFGAAFALTFWISSDDVAERRVIPPMVVAKRPSQEERLAKMSPIDVNVASVRALTLLPRIGPVLADAIVDERPFFTVDQLVDVSGIGTKTIEILRPHVQVNSDSLRKKFPEEFEQHNAKNRTPSSCSASLSASSK